MKEKLVLLFIFLLSSIIDASAQVKCGFDEVHNRKLKTDRNYRKRVQETEASIQQYIQKNKKRLSSRVFETTAALYTIPVVVHVIHTGDAVGTIYNPSDATIQDAINYLNQVYNGTYPGTTGAGDIEIQFALASRDPNCNTSTGINRVDGTVLSGYVTNGVNVETTGGTNELSVKNLSRWNPFDYYNIWIVNKIDGKDGTSGSFVGGFAYFPGGSPTYDGTIMLATQLGTGKKTLPHEIGHAFGLYHPFQDGNSTTCPTNTSCGTQGDRICDTDPVMQPSDFSCRTGTNPCTGTAYNDYTERNYMNYTNCYTLFTPGQKSRMLAVAASEFRLSLSTSSALTSTNIQYPYTAPIGASCTPVTSATGLGGHYIGIMNLTVNGKNFGSSTTPFDGGYVNGTNCIKLLQLVRGGTYSFSAKALNPNESQLYAWIDFNNDGAFDNTSELIHSNASFGSAQSYLTSGTFTVPTTAVTETALRMRAIIDASPIYGVTAIASACHNPVYGQGEDYPIYLSAPVILASVTDLKATLKGEQIYLSWEAKSTAEVKNYYVEKSTDGINFYPIGVVVASSGTRFYSFTDVQLDETNIYRVRSHYADGSSIYSNVIHVNKSAGVQNVKVSNPFSSQIAVTFARKASNVKLQLLGLDGRLIQEGAFSNPAQQILWSVDARLSIGMYILKIGVDEEIFHKKLVKQ